MYRKNLACVLFCLFVAACGGGGGGSPEPPGGQPPILPTGSLSGRVSFLSGIPSVAFEQEPNDAFDEAPFVAQLPVGGRLTLLGAVDADAGDVRDGYRLRARPRLRIHAVLKVEDSDTNDVSLEVIDPVAMQVVETFSAAEAAGGATFHANGDFDVVVHALSGEGAYELALAADAPFEPLSELEPNDDPGSAAYLGQLDADESLILEGAADAATDPQDGVLFLAPSAMRVDFELEHPAFSTFSIVVEDATASLEAPLPVARFDGTPSGPQRGGVDVAAGTLLHVAAVVTSGAGPWRLRIDAQGPTAGLALPTAVTPSPPSPGHAYLVTDAEILAGEAIVKFRSQAPATQDLARYGARMTGQGNLGLRRLSLEVAEGGSVAARIRATWSRIRALAGRADVEWVEPNFLLHPAAEPSDTYYPLQWHYDLIDLPRAWDLTTGDESVTVAVIDTGETKHPELISRQIPGYDLISSPSMAGDGDGIDGDPTDVGDGGSSGRHSWHGTHVAGTIGASSNDARGVSGVTWATQIMHVRALGIGGGTSFDVANAILYAARLTNSSNRLPDRRADIINLSLGGGAYSQTLADACAAARSAGVLVVASAGNNNTSTPSYPAAYPGVISVMAVDAASQRAPYSNYGSTVDLAAPGGDLGADRNGDGFADGVLSTLWDTSGNPAFAFYQGTSMACPHVAGLAALLLAEDQELTADELETLLTTTATDLGPPGRDDTFGHGLINAYDALVKVAGPPPPTPPVLRVNPEVLNFGQDTVELDVRIANHGGSFLDIEDVQTSTLDGGAWLQAVPAGQPTAAQGALRLTVRVNRVGLLTGTYRGAIDVVSNGGSTRIDVVMGVATTAAPPPNLDIIVVAIDADTGAEVLRTSVNPLGSLAFAFPALTVGRYFIQAGTDIDGDGILGEGGDYVGAYPLAGEAVALEVREGQEQKNVDFDVTFAPTLGTSPQ